MGRAADNTGRRGSRVRRGFTLLELSVVLIVMGLMAMAVVPALRTIDDTRRIGAAEDIERRLVNARAKAIATGRPIGVRLDPVGEVVQTMTIATPGAAPTALAGVMGEVEPAANIGASFPGAEIVSVTAGDGATGSQVIWFDFDGTPHGRSVGGSRTGAWTADGVVVMSGGYRVTIRRGSGGIER